MSKLSSNNCEQNKSEHTNHSKPSNKLEIFI